MKILNNFIDNNIKKIIMSFIIIQPILDAITGINLNFFNITFPFTPIVRLIFMLICMYYVIFINREKNDFKRLVIQLIYMIIFVVSVLVFKGKYALTYEITNLLNTFYLPILVVCLLNIFKHKKICLDFKFLVTVYLIYLALIIIPNVTGTAFLSYSHSKVGHVGWFPLANVIGNVLCILFPLIIYYLVKSKKKYLFKFLIIVSILYVFVSMGTKVPLLGLLICLFFNFIFYIISLLRKKDYKKLTISCSSCLVLFIFALLLIPKTAFYKNIQIHKDFLGINNYSEILTDYNLIDHFVFSQRLTFLSTIHNSNKDCGIVKKIIGIGYIKNYGTDISTKTIEIDYFDILYENGILGFVVFLYIMLPIFIQAFKKVKSNSFINLQYRISLFLILLISLFAGHMLISPAASLFVALILVFIVNGGLNEKVS